MTYEAILAIIMTFAPWWQDIKEPADDRKDRMTIITQCQVEVGAHLGGTENGPTEKEVVALLLTAGWWETRYNRRIHEGNCYDDECDGGRARSVYQVQKNGTYPDELWEDSEGLDKQSTCNATLAAGLSFMAAWRACHETHGTKGVWSAYGRGVCRSSYPNLISRVRWYKRVLKRL